MDKIKNISAGILQGAVRRKADEQKYQKEIYGEKRKTEKSKGTRVDKRLFNKGRPKKVKVEANVDISISKPVVSTKKLNQVEKVAGQVIAGYMRSKLEANILQPAIYSDLLGKKINERLDKGLPPLTPRGMEKIKKMR